MNRILSLESDFQIMKDDEEATDNERNSPEAQKALAKIGVLKQNSTQKV